MKNEKRIADREPLALPVSVSEVGSGVTRDVSASGLFISLDGDFKECTIIDFTIELSINDRPVLLVGKGEVVRVESNGKNTGVAVKMLTSQLRAAD
jgi:nitrous oxidase accessory protein NosD